MPKPTFHLSIQIIDQFTRCDLCSKAPFPERKSLGIFSSLTTTLFGMTKKYMKQIGKLEKVFLIKVCFHPFDKYCLLHKANLF